MLVCKELKKAKGDADCNTRRGRLVAAVLTKILDFSRASRNEISLSHHQSNCCWCCCVRRTVLKIRIQSILLSINKLRVEGGICQGGKSIENLWWNYISPDNVQKECSYKQCLFAGLILCQTTTIRGEGILNEVTMCEEDGSWFFSYSLDITSTS